MEIEKYGRPRLMATEFQMLLSGCEARWTNVTPVAAPMMSAEGVTVGLRWARGRT